MSPVVDSVRTHARARAAAPACVDLELGRRWTYAELDRDVDAVAGWLVERLGPRSGERVATIGRNSVALLTLHLACARAGAIYVPFNWRLAPSEVAVLAEDAHPALLFHDAEFQPPRCGAEDHLVAELEGIASAGGSAPVEARRPMSDPATLLYTSGTSGRPKGVIVTEANAFWGCTNFILGNDVTIRSVFLCDMPMFHTAGLFAAVRVPLLAGGTVLISRGFDPVVTLSRLADPGLSITHYFSVPQMAGALWNQPGFRPEMLHGLTTYAMGGAPNPAAQIRRFVEAGVAMSDGFGMSETGSNFGMPVADPDCLIEKAGSCGLPYLSIEARIVDAAGRDVADGERGELWLRGPSVTPGYWNQPELTSKAFQDGWFMTGDTAMRDEDGFYFLVDRVKDMYISGGENVYPAEVEAVIAELDGVAEVAVIGVPDERWGEVGRAYVIAAEGRGLSHEAVLSHCRSRLAGFKAPGAVVIGEPIPRTATGKAQKHLLKARALAPAASLERT
jgi:fatty-acyl-CoA synthase